MRRGKWSLAGKVVLVTGSSGGLGTALCGALRRRGALLDLDPGAVQAQAAALGSPADVRGWPADVRDLETLKRVCAEAAEHFGGIDVVVAAAGIDYMAPLGDLTPDTFERIIDVNLIGVWRTFHAALPFVTPRRGYLLAVSSMAAFVHSPLQGPYSASKAGVWALCDSLRLEVRHQGVGGVYPTFFETPIMDNLHIRPANRMVWNDHRGPFWSKTTLPEVALALVEAIETRAELVTVPGRLRGVALLAGLLRPFGDRFAFAPGRIQRAVALARRKLRAQR